MEGRAVCDGDVIHTGDLSSMAQNRLHRALLGLPWPGYVGKIVIFAALAATAPLAAAVSLALAPHVFSRPLLPGLLIGAATLASALALSAIGALLTAISQAAAEVRACARLASAPEPAGRGDELAVMADDIRHLSSKLEGVRHRLANRHPVTGIATREPFFAAVAEDVKRQAKSATLGVVRFAQFDRLAAVDRPAADNALRAFAARLTVAAGPGHPLAQVDRDCFALWVHDPTGPKAAAQTLRRIAEALGQPIGEGDQRILPDVRLGAAIYPNDGADGPTLLNRATLALGKAGRVSAHRLAFYSEDSSEAAQERFVMEQALRQALARDELALHYQPVIDLTGARVVGAEALLRWRHPELGQIPPARFLPVLEQSGLMREVGAWIFDRACADARAFEALGLTPFKMGINLTQRQFRDPGLPAAVAAALRRHDLKPDRLELELNEAALMADLAYTRRVLGQLAVIGVGVAIDDFGSGASSLGDL
jgi:predicted signal transduction protein with EAL and GGDEF domain